MCISNFQRMMLPFALLFALMVTGCGGGGGGGEGTKPIPINSPPTLTLVSPTTGEISLDVTQTQYVDLKVRTDDPDGNKLHCIWLWDAGSVTPSEQDSSAGSTVTAKFTPPKYNGTCKVKLIATDGQASVEKEFTITISGNNVQPDTEVRITSIAVSPQPVLPSQSTSLIATVENPKNKPLAYQWKTKYGQIVGTGPSVTWNAAKDPGIYGVYLTVNDGTADITNGRAITVSGPDGGLRAQYYKTKREKNVVYLDKLMFTRIDPTIKNNWGKLSPDPSKLPGDGWGARWTGFVKCEEPGSYEFTAFVDDGIRIRVQNDSGQWVGVIPNNTINWDDHTSGAWLPESPEAIQLQGGKWYPIEVEYFEGGGDAFIELYWSVNGRPKTIISQGDLKPPS